MVSEWYWRPFSEAIAVCKALTDSVVKVEEWLPSWRDRRLVRNRGAVEGSMVPRGTRATAHSDKSRPTGWRGVGRSFARLK